MRMPLVLCLLMACNPGKGQPGYGDPSAPQVPDVDVPDTAHDACRNGPEVIIDTPESYSRYLREDLSRYAEVVAPNGSVIAIFAHEDLGDVQILRARNLLRGFLEDHPGSRYGADKTAVANAMADNGAVLVLPSGEHEEGNEPDVPAQPLYEDETPVAGHRWFMDNDYDHRDAAMEEIFHLVHDAGIGTYMPGALPDYQDELLAEAESAIEDGRWGIPAEPGVEEWLEELEEEDSLAQEYIASVIDSTYGLWGPWDEGEGGMWGVYIAKTRDEVASKDPAGLELFEAFLPGQLPLPEPVHPDFDGTLSLVFDADEPYTHKSRYFDAVHLLGSGDATVLGHEGDNTFVSNAGSNVLDGGEGTDTVVYCGSRDDYTLSGGEPLTVTHTDGAVDNLSAVELLHFFEGEVAVEDL